MNEMESRIVAQVNHLGNAMMNRLAGGADTDQFNRMESAPIDQNFFQATLKSNKSPKAGISLPFITP